MIEKMNSSDLRFYQELSQKIRERRSVLRQEYRKKIRNWVKGLSVENLTEEQVAIRKLGDKRLNLRMKKFLSTEMTSTQIRQLERQETLVYERFDKLLPELISPITSDRLIALGIVKPIFEVHEALHKELESVNKDLRYMNLFENREGISTAKELQDLMSKLSMGLKRAFSDISSTRYRLTEVGLQLYSLACHQTLEGAMKISWKDLLSDTGR